MSVINLNELKNFLKDQYARNLIFKTNNVEILLVCWTPGQGAEVHEHGTSDAITLILEGEMAHTTYYPDGTKVSGTLLPGDIEHITAGVKHEARNNSNKNLVSLHIYSPPLETELLKSSSLGYSNKTKIETLKVLEKTISYLMAEKPNMSQIKKDLSFIVNKRPKRPTITIIGGGFSGALTAAQLMQKATEPVQIILIERASRFAKGTAYSTVNPMHLLNVPANKMSVFPDKPDHFLRWVEKENLSIRPQSFVSRMLYGKYLDSILLEAESNKSPNVNFKRINDEAISIELETFTSSIIHLQSGVLLPTNLIVLALGNYLPRDIKIENQSFYKSKKYFRDPWSPNVFKSISHDDSVLLIGTGLTMIDKAVELMLMGHKGTIHAISRHGLLPQSHNLEIKQLPLEFDFKYPLKIKSLLEIVRQKSISLTAQGGDWRQVIDTLRPHVQKLWGLMDYSEKPRFLRHLKHYWEVYRHRMPPEIASIINSMLKSGQLKIYKGRIINFNETNRLVNVTLKERASKSHTNIQVSQVVNCTGSETDYRQINDPLIVNLLEQGFIVPDKHSLGLDVASNGALIDINGNISKMFYTLGPPLKGALWETTAVPEIRDQAANLALELIQVVTELKDYSPTKTKEEVELLTYHI